MTDQEQQQLAAEIREIRLEHRQHRLRIAEILGSGRADTDEGQDELRQILAEMEPLDAKLDGVMARMLDAAGVPPDDDDPF